MTSEDQPTQRSVLTTQSSVLSPQSSKIAVIFGTRPEAIKLAPVIEALRRPELGLDTRVVVTGQHREMLDQVLAVFDIRPDRDLRVMQPGQRLGELTGALMAGLEPILAEERPDLVLVQGDTSTVLLAALAAFYQRIPVGHVEAGLRTDDRYNPFPEEINRRLTSVVARLHFAPTDRARHNLLREGVPADRIFVTGNTVVDALQRIRRSDHLVRRPGPVALGGGRLLLVTLHRRESWGEPLRATCRAIRSLVEAFSDLEVVFPVHLNPAVQQTVRPALAGLDRVHLIDPVDYLEFVWLLERASLILTDSGGIQEEASALGKPVLVARETTERPEVIEAGAARLVGTDETTIRNAAGQILTDPALYRRMAQPRDLFGDGRAAERIAEITRRFLRERRGGERRAESDERSATSDDGR